MGSRSWLFSGSERGVTALVSPHCFPTHASCRDRGVYHLRLPQIENRRKQRSGGVARAFGGLPA
jgi:hypothetical protein